MTLENYIVYVKVDENSTIVDINSSAFVSDPTGWVEIDSGIGDEYHHAQGNYLPLGLVDANRVYNYKLVDGVVQERTSEEKEADLASQIPPITLEMLAECIMELSEVVYA